MSTEIQSAERQPGPIQIAILLFSVGVSVLVTAILGPSIKNMIVHFTPEHGDAAEGFVKASVAIPMLIVALFAMIAGAISDRIGRKWLLVGASALYALIGTAPLYLESLESIFASRIALGFAEAVVMVTGVALIGDFFKGAQRERLLALQTTAASASAVALNFAGGALGEFGWRMPFWGYTFGLVLAISAAIFLWEPKRRTAADIAAEAATDHDAIKTQPIMITFTCILAVLMGIAFLVVPIHFSDLFAAIGETSTGKTGPAFGLNSLGVIIGTITFAWGLNSRVKVGGQMAIGCTLAAIGFIGMWQAGTYLEMTLSGFINGIGFGILLPTLVTWNMRLLPPKIRGFGAGAWQAGFFLGNFLNVFVIGGLMSIGQVGTHANAVMVIGVFMAISAVLGVVGFFMHSGSETKSAAH